MIECFACGTNFEIKFEDEDTKLNYCPHCGEESVDEIIIEDIQDIDEYFYEDEDIDK
jgi:rRNA maturation endonuclease Nob1